MNKTVTNWVRDVAEHTSPDAIHYCDGSPLELRNLEEAMLADGTLILLNEEAFPRSYLHRSNPNDVARSEQQTFICSDGAEDAGPTNNWMSPADAERDVWALFKGAMRGRTMYVVPYLMGPSGSPYSRVGVQVTDSPYVVASLRRMTRMGEVALRHLGDGERFVRGIHSLGRLDPSQRYILHFPRTRTIWSINSGYGGNALLSKKCHALRIASVEGRDEGWLAEHMMIVGVTNPQGVKHYVAAAFPSACGKTNLAMLVPNLPGWKVETIGDDICWMHVGSDGRLWAINPEAGFFGVAPGTNAKTNPNAIAMISHDTIFTNVALRQNQTPWWEGLHPLEAGERLTNWKGQPWSPGTPEPAAHPNSRFTVAAEQCPSVGRSFFSREGVPISAILFGARRAQLTPLVYESRDFTHGVYVGATLVSETTAAAIGNVGVPRNDPMAMLPFCGYHMGDYFGHWLSVATRLTRPPKVFHVNWFRTDANGRFLWPGFGDNIRVLDWVLRRVDGQVGAKTTPIGYVPDADGMNLSALDMDAQRFEELIAVHPDAWLAEADRNTAFLDRFGGRLPDAIRREHQGLIDRLRAVRG